MTDERGGYILKTGKIGHCNVLRQQLLAPGESIRTNMSGRVMLEAMRERESFRVHAHLGTFLTPVRWLQSNWPTFIKEGPDTAETLGSATLNNLSKYGIGSAQASAQYLTMFRDSVLRIYNEWYKWPEDADATSWQDDGEVAVPLQAAWNRCRYNIDPSDSDDYTLASATSFDVRDLAETQAKFRSAIERDVLSYNRYMELLREMFNADGSREVDQVPMMVDQTELGVSPRENAATDGASLGAYNSVYDFGVDHVIPGISAPEHCILTYILTVRFSPVIESRNPLSVEDIGWVDAVGDPEILRNMKPQDVRIKDVATSTSTTSLGYLPAGWRWRHGWDVVGRRIDAADSFPHMRIPSTQAEAKDASRVKEAFRSAALGDYLVDIHCSEKSRNLHGAALESYFSGMTGASSKSEHPKGGKML